MYGRTVRVFLKYPNINISIKELDMLDDQLDFTLVDQAVVSAPVNGGIFDSEAVPPAL